MDVEKESPHIHHPEPERLGNNVNVTTKNTNTAYYHTLYHKLHANTTN